MKKVLFSMAMFSMVALMAACGGNKEEKKADPATDGKTAAEMKCKCQALEGEAADKCNTEADAKYNELKKQYKDDQLKAFEDAYNKGAEECSKKDEEPIDNGATNDNDNNNDAAKAQAIEEAAQAICNCAGGDKAKIEACLNEIINAGYTAFAGDENFTKAVYGKALQCAAEKKVNELKKDAINEAANQLSKMRN